MPDYGERAREGAAGGSAYRRVRTRRVVFSAPTRMLEGPVAPLLVQLLDLLGRRELATARAVAEVASRPRRGLRVARQRYRLRTFADHTRAGNGAEREIQSVPRKGRPADVALRHADRIDRQR